MRVIIENAKWLCAPWDTEEPPVFRKEIPLDEEIKSARLTVTAMGIYEAVINGERVSDYLFAPGWTMYDKRLQYQSYDVTACLKRGENILDITAGNGWCVGKIGYEGRRKLWADKPEILASLELEYASGEKVTYLTDGTWKVGKGPIRSSDFFDGEVYDARITPCEFAQPVICSRGYDNLIPQEGDEIRTIEELSVKKVIVTPKGETVLDFGQNITGMVEFEVEASAGDEIEINHAEVLDADGNFYTKNYRGITAHTKYVCKDGYQKYRPHFSFQGFRYIRLNKWPHEIKDLTDAAGIKAHVVHTVMERTGDFKCSDAAVNRLFENIVWGQKDNFLDVPTDCPQRDERCGWTGDALAFIRTASYNYNVENFFRKWLRDLKACQAENGSVPRVVPNILYDDCACAAWADAAVICPWQVYMTYGNRDVLSEQFESMRRWVEFVRAQGENEYLWESGRQYGDWMAFDGPCPWEDISQEAEYSGGTHPYLVSSAFYARSTELLVKAGNALGKDMSEYSALYEKIRSEFQKRYMADGKIISDTQTAWTLALQFGLAPDRETAAKNLAGLIKSAGGTLKTGFVGTPHLLHALSDNGYEHLAYSLLLRRECPSWLYAVERGATTMWERWDAILPDGSINKSANNSFNHYAYGAVGDWLYQTAAGIAPTEQAPGFKHIRFAPKSDERLDWCKAEIKTAHGKVSGGWHRDNGRVTYELTVPYGCTAEIALDGINETVGGGTHKFVYEETPAIKQLKADELICQK